MIKFILVLTLGSTSGLQGWEPRAVRWPRDLDFFLRLMMLCFWNMVLAPWQIR